MKFRHQRGSLKESMATVQEVETLEDIRSILSAKRKEIGLEAPIGELTCKHYSYDSRINWDTWIICENGSAIGFSNGELF